MKRAELSPQTISLLIAARRVAVENDAQAVVILAEVPYDRWRDYDPEDSLRFYALRLHVAGHRNRDRRIAPRAAGPHHQHRRRLPLRRSLLLDPG